MTSTEGNSSTNPIELESGLIFQTNNSLSSGTPTPLTQDAAPLSSGGKPPWTERITSFKRLLVSTSKRGSWTKNGSKRLPSSAEIGLKSLRFLHTANGKEGGGWHAVEKSFDLLAVDGRLIKQNFGSCIGMDTKEFAEKLFDTLARRRGIDPSYGITKDEMKIFWDEITDQDFNTRLQIFFDMCDKNGDGRLTEDEVKEVIILSATTNKLEKMKAQAATCAALILEKLDPDHLGYIELWQLDTLFRWMVSLEGSDQTMTKQSESLMKAMIPRRYRHPISRCTSKAVDLVQENWKRIWVLSFWLVLNISLFTWKFSEYRRRAAFEIMGYCVCVAKGSAETLKLNMALIIFPVCRNTLTRLRSTGLSKIIPFDDNITFHKIIAIGIIFSTLLHTLFHMACDFPRLMCSQKQKFMRTLGSNFGFKQPTYRELVASIPGWTGIVMVTLMTFSFVLATHSFRKNAKQSSSLHYLAGFNAFWYAHHLLTIVYALVIPHSYFIFLTREWYKKTTWMYVLVPVIFFTCEALIRRFREKYYNVDVVKASLYTSGDVLSIQMTKPPGFTYKSGMYLFVKCPNISSFEWHPFSITSAPGDNYLSIHIKTAGDWTTELRNLFGKVPGVHVASKIVNLDRQETTVAVDDQLHEAKFPRLLIDGPYGAPAQNYTNYDILLLIGLGIGATPFISILKDLLNNIISTEEEQCIDRSNLNKIKLKGPRRAYFYWVTREQASLEWFTGVMNNVAECDQNHAIELHNYLTSVHEEGDVRSALVALVQFLQRAKNGVDIVSGSWVHTHFARPNWRKVFSELADKHKNSDIGVFYCGRSTATKQLRALSHEFSNNTTHFHFHKENF